MTQPNMMQGLFVVQIAMLAHEVNRAYCEAIGDPVAAQWDQCSQPIQQSAVNSVDFWLANPNSPPQAAHESWVAARAADGWRLGSKIDEVEKTHPNMRPFAALSKDQQVKDSLFRGVVRAVTYSHDIGPKIQAQTALVQQGIINTFGEHNAENVAKWNLLTEEERKAACDEIVEKSQKMMAIAAANGLTPEMWNAMTEEARQVMINTGVPPTAETAIAANDAVIPPTSEAEMTEFCANNMPGFVGEEEVATTCSTPLPNDTINQMLTQHDEAKMAIPTVKLASYDGIPDTFDLTATVQLSRDVMVAAAQQASSYSEEEWNTLDADHRKEYIDSKFNTMKIEAETAGLV